MADEEYGDDGFAGADYFYDDDWLYIEDEVAFADELAETQIPSPGYIGVNAELTLESYEYDTYEYFGELEYGSDAYWDVRAKSIDEPQKTGPRGTNKRKRASGSGAFHTDKRQRLRVQAEPDIKNVLWRKPRVDNTQVDSVTTESPSYALLPDWRKRFPEDANVTWRHDMPEEMKRAAQADDHENGPLARAQEEAGQPEHDLLSIDPQALISALRSKLGDSGMDETAFMDVISQMLNGGESDDAITQLASKLLGKGTGDNEAALGWLAHQGVCVRDAEEEDGIETSESSADATEMPAPTARRSRRDQNSSRK